MYNNSAAKSYSNTNILEESYTSLFHHPNKNEANMKTKQLNLKKSLLN